MANLSPAQIKVALARVPGWRRRASVISRTYEFKNFVVAIKFVNAVARAAERAWHHPDLDIRWNRVTLALTTHDAGGLTEKDFALAALFDRLASSGK
ncbi:MAG: 4a-hydroxytetrahydrobiopterin dehydratase [Verrucomicrobia bacterium]|nr:4a-hydroxytetrahydrobiopterin dehydratase [Verrucomicrobiota bacterium]